MLFGKLKSFIHSGKNFTKFAVPGIRLFQYRNTFVSNILIIALILNVYGITTGSLVNRWYKNLYEVSNEYIVSTEQTVSGSQVLFKLKSSFRSLFYCTSEVKLSTSKYFLIKCGINLNTIRHSTFRETNFKNFLSKHFSTDK